MLRMMPASQPNGVQRDSSRGRAIRTKVVLIDPVFYAAP